MDPEAAAAFWSYTHLDDESENGRITRLADDVKKEYRLLTGGELEIFLDREAIQWGDNLRERIDEALAGTTFFIPIITPTYFKRPECRRELIAFSQEVKRLDVEALLLPVYYTEVPEFLQDGELKDEAMQLVKETKWEDWTGLRLEDLASAEYRKGVHRLAQRLANVVRDLTTQTLGAQSIRHRTSETITAQEEQGEDEEEPGLLDLLAEGEEGMPELADIASKLGPEIEGLGQAATQASGDMSKNNASGGGASGGLKVAVRLAERLHEPSRRILDLGQRNAATLVKVDPAISAVIGQIEADPNEALKDEDVRTYIQAIRGMAASGRQATESLGSLSASLASVGGASRVLRPVLRDIQTGLRGFVDAQAIYDEWDRRLATIEASNAKEPQDL